MGMQDAARKLKPGPGPTLAQRHLSSHPRTVYAVEALEICQQGSHVSITGICPGKHPPASEVWGYVRGGSMSGQVGTRVEALSV